MKLGCVLMAAGISRRFGGDKLLKPFRGVPLYQLALAAIPGEAFSTVAVVSGTDEILSAGEKLGFVPILNRKPEEGASLTIRLGLEALKERGVEAAMFLVADQPLLTWESVKEEIAFFLEEPGLLAAMGHEERRGNPALFPGKYFSELLSLEGDQGGSVVLRRHSGQVRLYQIQNAMELFDVDTAEEFEELETGKS